MDSPNPIRVLFLFERAETWLNLHPLWRVMRDDLRFSPEVWVIPPAGLEPATRDAQRARCLTVCRERDVPAVAWRDGQALEPGRFDVAVFNSPYDRNRPSEFYFDFVARKVRFTVYLPYGLVTGDGNKNRRLQYAQPAQRRADLVVARSRHEKQAYRRLCPSGDRHVAVLGLPRFDELHDLGSFPVDPDLRARTAGRLALLWNAHYSFLPRFAAAENYSTFDRIGGELLAYAARRPEIALIWRPHPHLLPELVGAGILRGEELTPLRREIEELGVILDERPDYRHAFAVSQALLSDAGSFLFEYLVTGNPVLYLRNPDGEPLNREATALIEHYDVAESGDEAVGFIEDLLQHGDRRREERLAARAAFLPMFDGRASQRVAERIAALCGDGSAEPATPFDPSRFPLMVRLASALDRIRARKEERHAAARGLVRLRTAAKEWTMGRLTEHPGLLKVLTAVLERLGLRKASGG